MSILIIGIIWTSYICLMSYLTFDKNTIEDISISEIVIFLFIMFVLLIFGVGMIIKGIKEVLKNLSTFKNGEECYGRIIKIYRSTMRINSKPVLNADFAVYIPSLNRVEIVCEKIGTNRKKFSKEVFYKLKYYNGDINIGKIAEIEDIPGYIIDCINEIYNDNAYEKSFVVEDLYNVAEKVKFYGERKRKEIIVRVAKENKITLKEATEAVDNYLDNCVDKDIY